MGERIEVTFRYDKTLVRTLRSIPGATIISGGWSIPRQFFKAFVGTIGKRKIDLDPSLRTPEQLALFTEPSKLERRLRWASDQEERFSRAVDKFFKDHPHLTRKINREPQECTGSKTA